MFIYVTSECSYPKMCGSLSCHTNKYCCSYYFMQDSNFGRGTSGVTKILCDWMIMHIVYKEFCGKDKYIYESFSTKYFFFVFLDKYHLINLFVQNQVIHCTLKGIALYCMHITYHEPRRFIDSIILSFFSSSSSFQTFVFFKPRMLPLPSFTHSVQHRQHICV